MRYINADMVLQDAPCELLLTLHNEGLVNTVRYKSEPYTNNRGQKRRVDLYIPREVFNDTSIPDSVNVRVLIDLD